MVTKNPWIGFEGDGYRIKNLGRPATFLIPADRLDQRMGIEIVRLRHRLHTFLLKEFGAYTTSSVPSFGLWQNGRREIVADACVQYEVAFAGTDGIRRLLPFLAEIARATGENCFYFKAGEDACLIYPKNNA